jgi:hypothetical protein
VLGVVITGAAAGALDITGSAAGVVRVAAAGAGALPLTGAAIGTVRVSGAASGVLLLTGAAAGIVGEGLPQEVPIRTAVLDAIVVALQGAAITVRGQAVTVERSRTDMIAVEERPLVAVVGGDQEALPSDTLTQRYSLRVILAGYPPAETVAVAEADAAELHARCVRALIRPDPAALPVALLLADGTTEVWLTEDTLRVEPVSVMESEAPLAHCAIAFTADVHARWGNPFVTV